MKNLLLCIGSIFFAFHAFGQSLTIGKLSPSLRASAALEPVGYHTRFLLQCSDTAALRQMASGAQDSIRILRVYGNIVSVSAYPQWIRQHLLTCAFVTFIGSNDRKIHPESVINGFDYSTNFVNKLHSNAPSINGNGTVVSVREDLPDTSDVDFKGRFLQTTPISTFLSTHATIMSTIIAGGGNSFYTGKGVAWGSSLSSSAFGDLLPDEDAFYRSYGITVQNHSYGTGIENYYGADAAAYDASVVDNPTLLHVFSAGNSGDSSAAYGLYSGLTGWANLTGSFKMAKNILTVASIDSFYQVPLLSSKGPAYDGRIKPDLAAFGEDGSSGAAALVSGTALLLQQVYKEAHGGQTPDAALVKAILLNSAMETGNKGIDFSSGFGSLDAWRATKEMKAGNFFGGTVNQGEQQQFSLQVPANAVHLKILLCWTDPPATANAPVALVNDLDLRLQHVSSGASWQPWVLNTAASNDSLVLLPVRQRDSLNPQEQITLDKPPPGEYLIQVKGSRISPEGQKFFVAYQWDTAGQFEWMYPSANDNLTPGQPSILRWQNQSSSPGSIEYQLAGSGLWMPAAKLSAASSGYVSWTVPDTMATALLRMNIGGTLYTSDTFTITSRLNTGVGFNCPDSFLLYWEKKPVSGYRLYQLGGKYLLPVTDWSDTAIIQPAVPGNSDYYAVSPLLPFNREGLRSYGFDYTNQGVDCYIRTFTADLISGTARLRLELGSNYNVNDVVIERQYPGGYRALEKFDPVSLDFSAVDDSLQHGTNTYRARLDLSGGQKIYSSEQLVYYAGNDPYFVYPNPVRSGELIHVVATGLNNPVLQLYNTAGQLVMKIILTQLTQDVPVKGLAPGLYFYLLQGSDGETSKGKLVLY